MAEKLIISGELESVATGNKVADVSNIKDKTQGNKSQAQINDELNTALNDRYTKEETYSKTQLDIMITTPQVQYVTVEATSETTDVHSVLPETGTGNTVYRVGKWDGTQYDVTCYTKYSWDGTDYVPLATESQVDEVFDISVYRATGGTPATYADLAAALVTNGTINVPEGIRKGGMSVKFIQSSDNKYVQYFLTKDEWSLNEGDWEKINLEEKVSEISKQSFENLDDNEIDFLNDDDEVVAKLKDSGDFECANIKTENLDHEVAETLNPVLDEEIFSDDEESEEFVKIGNYGIKAKKYLNLDGTPLIPEDNGFICLTDTIYTFVGSEVCIYADAIIKSMDRGLMSPMNYRVIWNCEIGIVSDRFYRLDPQSGDVGNHTLRTRVYDMNNMLVMDKETTIIVLNISSLSSQKNILFVGDSLGADTATQIFNRIDGLGGTFPNFVGSQGSVSGKKYEARGGWRFADYAGVGRPQYRVIVSGVTSLSRGSVYSDGNNTYTIAETNIDASGDGNIAMTFSSGAPAPSGTLAKVSGAGDATISVVSATLEGGNPFWNTNTNQLDIANYRSLIGLSGKIDIVIFQLLVNDAGYQMPVNLVKSEIESLYSAFISDNQNTIILISLGTTWGNTISGTRTNGGANFDTTIPEKFMWEYRKMLLSDFANNANYPNIRISCVGSQLDRYYGYELGTYRTSKYVSEPYTAHVNYVHPGTIGYQQLAEAWVSEILSLN